MTKLPTPEEARELLTVVEGVVESDRAALQTLVAMGFPDQPDDSLVKKLRAAAPRLRALVEAWEKWGLQAALLRVSPIVYRCSECRLESRDPDGLEFCDESTIEEFRLVGPMEPES